MVIYTSLPVSNENNDHLIFVDESDYATDSDDAPFETRNIVRIRANEKFSKFYDCFDELGEGKFGKVYRCKERVTGLELAAKRVKIKRDADRAQVEREVAIMTQLRHSRIAQIYDAFSTPENDIVLVMEVVKGGELFDRVVDESYVLTEMAVVMIICQLCEAISYIHSKNIVHLDIKPENIMCVSQTGNRIKLIDFGLAQYYDGSSNLLFMAGTPEFVAPEVIKYEPIDFYTDMWSIGVITYILLSGISPFLGETLGETYCAVEKGKWEFDEEAFEGISEAAKDFIAKLLVLDQRKRMLPEDCLKHEWIVGSRSKAANDLILNQPAKGQLLSKECIRSYIRNKKFKKAAWALVFLARYKKYGLMPLKNLCSEQITLTTDGPIAGLQTETPSRKRSATASTSGDFSYVTQSLHASTSWRTTLSESKRIESKSDFIKVDAKISGCMKGGKVKRDKTGSSKKSIEKDIVEKKSISKTCPEESTKVARRENIKVGTVAAMLSKFSQKVEGTGIVERKVSRTGRTLRDADMPDQKHSTPSEGLVKALYFHDKLRMKVEEKSVKLIIENLEGSFASAKKIFNLRPMDYSNCSYAEKTFNLKLRNRSASENYEIKMIDTARTEVETNAREKRIVVKPSRPKTSKNEEDGLSKNVKVSVLKEKTKDASQMKVDNCQESKKQTIVRKISESRKLESSKFTQLTEKCKDADASAIVKHYDHQDLRVKELGEGGNLIDNGKEIKKKKISVNGDSYVSTRQLSDKENLKINFEKGKDGEMKDELNATEMLKKLKKTISNKSEILKSKEISGIALNSMTSSTKNLRNTSCAAEETKAVNQRIISKDEDTKGNIVVEDRQKTERTGKLNRQIVTNTSTGKNTENRVISFINGHDEVKKTFKMDLQPWISPEQCTSIFLTSKLIPFKEILKKSKSEADIVDPNAANQTSKAVKTVDDNSLYTKKAKSDGKHILMNDAPKSLEASRFDCLRMKLECRMMVKYEDDTWKKNKKDINLPLNLSENAKKALEKWKNMEKNKIKHPFKC